MTDRDFQNEELNLLAQRTARSMIGYLQREVSLVDAGSDNATSMHTNENMLTASSDMQAWQKLQGELEDILHVTILLRARLDVSLRHFEVFWPDPQATVIFPDESRMGWDGPPQDGMHRIQAIMFPGLKVKGNDGGWRIVCKSAVCVDESQEGRDWRYDFAAILQ